MSIEERIEKILYEIEDWFDNGERRGDMMSFKDGKVLAEKVDKMLRTFAADLLKEQVDTMKGLRDDLEATCIRENATESIMRHLKGLNDAIAQTEKRIAEFRS